MTARTLLLTALAMLAFAGNSLLCRLALKASSIDASTFTSVRLLCGALTLWLLLRLRTDRKAIAGNWAGAACLFIYASTFSYAYISLDTGVGALLLFGAVQVSMIVYGLCTGERFNRMTSCGLLIALAGLIMLLLPGARAPALSGALLMMLAGVAWGAYSLLGRRVADPLAATAGNFIRAIPFTLLLNAALLTQANWDTRGLLYAAVSGALTSGIGYAIWYTALAGLKSFQAATVQLSVPILAALAGSLFLDEALSLRLILSSVAVLGGVALVLCAKQRTP